jgi:hypothetical protein
MVVALVFAGGVALSAWAQNGLLFTSTALMCAILAWIPFLTRQKKQLTWTEEIGQILKDMDLNILRDGESDAAAEGLYRGHLFSWYRKTEATVIGSNPLPRFDMEVRVQCHNRKGFQKCMIRENQNEDKMWLQFVTSRPYRTGHKNFDERFQLKIDEDADADPIVWNPKLLDGFLSQPVLAITITKKEVVYEMHIDRPNNEIPPYKDPTQIKRLFDQMIDLTIIIESP